MKTLTALAAGAAVLLTLAGPTLAASRSHVDTSDVNTVKTYGDQDLNNPPNRSGFSAYARSHSYGQPQGSYYYDPDNSGHNYPRMTGPNLPYPDRPYGDPDVDYPVTLVQGHPDVRVVADRESAISPLPSAGASAQGLLHVQ